MALYLEYTDQAADAYYTATLSVGVEIRYHCEEDASLVQVVEAPVQLDVCVCMTDVAALDEWVVVIVPGFGDAWVQSQSIESIVARPPSESCLTSLEFNDSTVPSLSSEEFVALTPNHRRRLRVRRTGSTKLCMSSTVGKRLRIFTSSHSTVDIAAPAAELG